VFERESLCFSALKMVGKIIVSVKSGVSRKGFGVEMCMFTSPLKHADVTS